MSEEMLIRYCAPTLAGIKTGNIFNCKCSDREEMCKQLKKLNIQLVPLGLRAIPIRCTADRVLVYVYRPSCLTSDLENPEAAELLNKNGYSTDNANLCVARLIKRINESEEFPHEIGLFLSYPVSDVKGFINGDKCKCVGCWKVYSDEKFAEKKFSQYKKCDCVYMKLWQNGRSLEKLTLKRA